MNKKTFTSKKRKAFSLIELSIVLIIIGLLVAGVTGGASLIKNAELRSITSEARGYQTAVNSFYAKYGGLPGDFGTTIGTTTPANALGNNDGLISFIAPITGPANKFEGNLAWQVLKNDNFVTDSFTPATSTCATATDCSGMTLSGGTNVPASKSKGGGWEFDNIAVNVLSTPTVSGVVNTVQQNVVIIFGGTTASMSTAVSSGIGYTMISTPTTPALVGGASGTPNNSQLLPTDALSIDNKIDDGAPDTGKVSAVNTATNNCNTVSAATLLAITTVGKYTTANAYKACILAFQVDPNS